MIHITPKIIGTTNTRLKYPARATLCISTIGVLVIIITINDDVRRFEFIPVGEKYEKLLEVFKNE